MVIASTSACPSPHTSCRSRTAADTVGWAHDRREHLPIEAQPARNPTTASCGERAAAPTIGALRATVHRAAARRRERASSELCNNPLHNDAVTVREQRVTLHRSRAHHATAQESMLFWRPLYAQSCMDPLEHAPATRDASPCCIVFRMPPSLVLNGDFVDAVHSRANRRVLPIDCDGSEQPRKTGIDLRNGKYCACASRAQALVRSATPTVCSFCSGTVRSGIEFGAMRTTPCHTPCCRAARRTSWSLSLTTPKPLAVDAARSFHKQNFHWLGPKAQHRTSAALDGTHRGSRRCAGLVLEPHQDYEYLHVHLCAIDARVHGLSPMVGARGAQLLAGGGRARDGARRAAKPVADDDGRVAAAVPRRG